MQRKLYDLTGAVSRGADEEFVEGFAGGEQLHIRL